MAVKTHREFSFLLSSLAYILIESIRRMTLKNTELERENDKKDSLESGDALVLPAGMKYGFSDCSEDLEMLEVTLPAEKGFIEL